MKNSAAKVSSDQNLTCRLVQGKDGAWRGVWERFEQMPVLLSPSGSSSSDAVISLDNSVEKFFREAGEAGHYDSRFFRKELDSNELCKRLIELLGAFVEMALSCDTFPILMHGGLLGWYWNKSMLPWDNDVDLCIRDTDLIRLAQFNSP